MDEKLPDFVLRMIDEKKELDERIKRLDEYIHSNNVNPYRLELFSKQLICMQGYSKILGERILNEKDSLIQNADD